VSATQTIDYAALAKQAGAINSRPAGNVDYAALAKQAGAITSQPAQQRTSVWQDIHDAFTSPEADIASATGGATAGSAIVGRALVGLKKLTGDISDWAKGKADAAQTAQQATIAKTGQNPEPIEAYSKRAGYDLLAHTTALANSFLQPENLAITGGVIAANTNPFTGIPVDAALVAHGGYGVVKNAPAASKGDPEAAERMLLSGSEMAGGAAGTAGQARVGYARLVQAFKPAAGPAVVEGGAGAGSSSRRSGGWKDCPHTRHHRPPAESTSNEGNQASGVKQRLGRRDTKSGSRDESG
jgi:hypothetical protein